MTDHGDIKGQLAAYALGALDAAETRALEAHLDGCAECRAELREHGDVLVSLAEGLPAPEVPGAMRERVLKRARAAREPGVALGDVTPAASTPAPRDATVRRFPTARRNSSAAAAGWLAAAAMAVIAILAGWGYLQAERDRAELEARIAEVESQARALLADAEARAVAAEDLVETMLAPNVSTASLSSTAEAPSIRLFWNRERNVVVVAAFDLPAPPAGRTYQLWGIDTAAGTAPLGLGTFETAADGRTVQTFAIPAGATFDLAAVTEEPAGGSPAPTTTPFLAGPVPAAN